MNKQDDKKRVTPKLRFPEFQAMLGWDTFKLNDVSTRILDKVGDKKLMPISITAGVGIVSQEEKFGKNISGKQYKNYLILNKGDFVYNKGNSKKYPQGAIYYLDKWKKVAAPNVFLCFRLKSDQVHGFYQGYFDNNAHGVQLQKYITSGARSDGLLNISADTFFNLSFAIPDPKEQQKIADYLSSIDELINLREQKLTALKQHKKGLMQQLFPSHNNLQASKQASKQIVYPKLRFPQFKDCEGWEIVELEELFDLTIQNEKANSFDKDKIITVKLHTLGVVKNERTDTLTGGANYFHRKAGDFIFSKIDFLNGAFGIVPNELDGFCSSSDIPSFSFKPESNANFFMYWLKANYLDFKIERAGTSNTLKRISPKALFAMQLPIPLPEEQQAIADCLSSLDKLISEENEQIGRLKDHKKGLMQQLFPKMQ